MKLTLHHVKTPFGITAANLQPQKLYKSENGDYWVKTELGYVVFRGAGFEGEPFAAAGDEVGIDIIPITADVQVRFLPAAESVTVSN